jgi:hypothetical protein
MTDIPEAALRARQMYLDGRKTGDIQKDTGLNLRRLHLWLAGGPEKDGVRPLPPIPRRRVNVSSGRHRNARAALIVRRMDAAEQQVREIESRLSVTPEELDSRERNARVLAVLVKTLRELSAVDSRTRRRRMPKDQDDDDLPRNLDELRRALSRRLDAMAAGDPSGISAESGTEGA